MPTPLGLGSTSVFGGNPSAVSQPSTPDYINLLNQLNRQGQQASNVGRIPGEANLEQQSSSNIASELKGQLPQDVLNLIAQQGAERGVAIGSPGSPNANAAMLRALGLTSLGQQQQGQADLTAAAGRNPGGPLVNLNTMLLGPEGAGYLNLGNPLNRLGLNLAATGPQPYTGPGANQGAPVYGGGGAPDFSWLNFGGGGIPSPAFPNPTDPNAVATTGNQGPWSLGPSGDTSPWGTDLTSSANSLDTLLNLTPAIPTNTDNNSLALSPDQSPWGSDMFFGDPFSDYPEG